MTEFEEKLLKEKTLKGNLDLYWFGGTSFIIKSSKISLGLDLYLSNVCMRKDGSFKRLVPSLVRPEQLSLDYLIATHDHGDHFDTGSLKKIMSKNTPTKLVGPLSVMIMAKSMKIDSKRLIELNLGEEIEQENIYVRAVFADHGEHAPDCIGVIIYMEGKRIYFTSDTKFRPDLPELVKLDEKIDLLIVPINGKWGNPDPKDASYITAWVKPEKVIPSHFWMFAENSGDPGAFTEYCRSIAPVTKIIIPAMGEKIII